MDDRYAFEGGMIAEGTPSFVAPTTIRLSFSA